MNTFVVLLRGINVGGKNPVPMASLREILESHGFSEVTTYIASGNVILKSNLSAENVRAQLEGILPEHFKLDDERISVLMLTREQLQGIIDHRPNGFGDQPDHYHSDVIFLIGMSSNQVMSVFDPREGVDQVWPGDGVVYSQRLSSMRSKSRLSKIVGAPAYKFMTIRNWNTTTALLELVKKVDTQSK